MFTKIRTATVVFISTIAAVLAMTSVFAAGAQAKPILIGPTSVLSPFGNRPMPDNTDCETSFEVYEGLAGDAVTDLSQGNADLAKRDIAAANLERGEAVENGCSWAS
jgi:hypothetical protein